MTTQPGSSTSSCISEFTQFGLASPVHLTPIHKPWVEIHLIQAGVSWFVLRWNRETLLYHFAVALQKRFRSPGLGPQAWHVRCSIHLGVVAQPMVMANANKRQTLGLQFHPELDIRGEKQIKNDQKRPTRQAADLSWPDLTPKSYIGIKSHWEVRTPKKLSAIWGTIKRPSRFFTTGTSDSWKVHH